MVVFHSHVVLEIFIGVVAVLRKLHLNQAESLLEEPTSEGRLRGIRPHPNFMDLHLVFLVLLCDLLQLFFVNYLAILEEFYLLR